MALVSLRQLLDEAAAGGYGIGAFNVNNMEQIQAIMEAAKDTDSPVIVQASRGARSYSQDNYLRHLMLAASELYPEIPIVTLVPCASAGLRLNERPVARAAASAVATIFVMFRSV